jgi:hypothetical protein
MIAREPLKRDPNAGRKPERAVLRNPGLVAAAFRPLQSWLPRWNGARWAFGSCYLGNPCWRRQSAYRAACT